MLLGRSADCAGGRGKSFSGGRFNGSCSCLTPEDKRLSKASRTWTKECHDFLPEQGQGLTPGSWRRWPWTGREDWYDEEAGVEQMRQEMSDRGAPPLAWPCQWPRGAVMGNPLQGPYVVGDGG